MISFSIPIRSSPMVRGSLSAPIIDHALYLPLFYGDAQGVVHPGAATEVPTVQNGGVSADAKTWTFHLRPAPGVVGWAALRCPRRGLHLEALGQSQVWCQHYPGPQPDQLGRRLGRPPLDHLPPQAPLLRHFSQTVGRWLFWRRCRRTISARWHPRPS